MGIGLVKRLLVVGWMVGGLFAAAVALAVPALLSYGLLAWLAGPSHIPEWVEVVLLWGLRLGLCASIWLLAKRASNVAAPQGPSRVTLAVAAVAGLVVGFLAGVAVRDAWGLRIVSSLGLPPESFLEDVVTVVTMAIYTAVVFGATYVPKRANVIA